MAQAQFWLDEGTIVGGRYTLEKVLGKGGYGITYKGVDNRLKIPVAIKEYYPIFWCSRFTENGPKVVINQGMEADYCKGLDRFQDEALTLAQLGAVNGVVRVTDFFEENGTGYLVMEYLDGRNLKQMLDGFGGRIPADVLIPVLSPVLFALRKIHDKGMIHRDLSPDNIMMLEDGSVCLIDFGNARDTTDNKSMTLAMKEGFAAPEQYRSKGQGTYTDVYGLCATLYYCLTGKLPPQAMDRLMGDPFLKPSQMGVVIPAWQEEAIMDGLELYVQKRIQNMEELWNRLYIEPAQEQPPIPEEPVLPADDIPVKDPCGSIKPMELEEPMEPIKPIDHLDPLVPIEPIEPIGNSGSDEVYYSRTVPAEDYSRTFPAEDMPVIPSSGPIRPISEIPFEVPKEISTSDYDAAVAALGDSLHNLRKVCAEIFKKVKNW